MTRALTSVLEANMRARVVPSLARAFVGVAVRSLLACSLLACSRSPRAPLPPIAPSAPRIAAQGSSDAAASASAPPGRACTFERGLHGDVGKLEVFARLQRSDRKLHGEYFYAHVGQPIALDGDIDEAGAVTLVEGDPTRPSGRFEGACDAGGRVHGLWRRPGVDAGAAAGDALPFALDPVGPRDDVLVATRKSPRHVAPKSGGEPRSDWVGFEFDKNAPCFDDHAWPEIFGAASPAIEQTINASLVRDEPVLDPDSARDMRACKRGERVQASRRFEVRLAAAGLLAIRSYETIKVENGTHPWDPGKEEWRTFDTHTGDELDKAALLPATKEGKAALQKVVFRCARAWAKTIDERAADVVGDTFGLSAAELHVAPSPEGLSFGATGYPPPARVMEGGGPTIRWASLLALGAMPDPAASPLGRIVRDVRPASPKDDPCASPRAAASPRSP
jgi:hypothetical protein